MKPIGLTVNDRQVQALVAPRTHLGDFLREQLRLTGTHLACEHGVCGACTVLLDGEPVRACIIYAIACDGREVRTIEGLDDDPLMNTLREAFSQEHGLQCGFCTPGMLIVSRDICLRKPGAGEEVIRWELSGNLCRCTGFVGIVNAVQRVMSARGMVLPVVEPRAVSAPAAMAPFVPTAAAAMTASPIAPARERTQANDPTPGAGGMRIQESVIIAAPPAEVWKFLGDIPVAAACLPGAEVVEYDGRSVKGRIQVKFGPMSAAFSGAATVERDDTEMTGTIRGAGTDGLSKTRARGELVYRLLPAGDERTTRIEITLSYSLVGPLAQFSRSGLVKDFVHRLTAEFARGLGARISGGAMPAHRAELPVGSMLLSALWRWIRRLCGAPE